MCAYNVPEVFIHRSSETIDCKEARSELKLHAELFDKLAYHLPKELVETKAAIEQRLAS